MTCSSQTLVLKLFLSVRKLNEPFHGGVGSFLLQSMVISFLKIVHVRGERTFQWRSTWQKMSLGALLHAFFDFYGERLNYDTVGLKVKVTDDDEDDNGDDDEDMMGGGGLFKKTKRNGWEQIARISEGGLIGSFRMLLSLCIRQWLALLAPQESVGKSLLSRIIRGEKITQFGKRKGMFPYARDPLKRYVFGQEKLHRWGGVSSDSMINPSPSSSSESSYDWSSTKKEGGKNSAYRASPNELKISLDFTSATPDGRPRRRVIEFSDDKDIDSSFERKRPKAKGGRGGRGGRRQSGEGRVGRNLTPADPQLPTYVAMLKEPRKGQRKPKKKTLIDLTAE
eukprot:jgi/Bigna1/66418/fgenesh1_pg.1_\